MKVSFVFLFAVGLTRFSRNQNGQLEFKTTRMRTHTIKVDLNDESSSPVISVTGEENYYSSSTELGDDSDTMESIDEALPPKLNIHQTKLTRSLCQYKGEEKGVTRTDESCRSAYVPIEAKEISRSPTLHYGEDSEVCLY